MPERDEFFVGYLPTPPGMKRFAVAAAAALLLLAGSVAAGASLLQRSPGETLRQKNQSITGVYEAAPYGHVRWLDEDGEPRHTLVVIKKKFGAQKYAALDGQVVTVKGLLMERDGRQLMELGAPPEATALPEGVAEALRALAPEPLGTVTVGGEIVDSKCYLGRMRPGSDRGHRACAQLCVSGGIPPVLVTRAPGGQGTHYLLAGPGGEPINEAVLPFIAEPIRVTGELERWGDLLLLTVDPTTIERL